MDGVGYQKICDLARKMVLDDIVGFTQDRMTQGEVLDDEGLLSWGNEKDEIHDNEAFGALESYLNYIHYIVEQTPIPLHVSSPTA